MKQNGGDFPTAVSLFCSNEKRRPHIAVYEDFPYEVVKYESLTRSGYTLGTLIGADFDDPNLYLYVFYDIADTDSLAVGSPVCNILSVNWERIIGFDGAASTGYSAISLTAIKQAFESAGENMDLGVILNWFVEGEGVTLRGAALVDISKCNSDYTEIFSKTLSSASHGWNSLVSEWELKWEKFIELAQADGAKAAITFNCKENISISATLLSEVADYRYYTCYDGTHNVDFDIKVLLPLEFDLDIDPAESMRFVLSIDNDATVTDITLKLYLPTEVAESMDMSSCEEPSDSARELFSVRFDSITNDDSVTEVFSPWADEETFAEFLRLIQTDGVYAEISYDAENVGGVLIQILGSVGSPYLEIENNNPNGTNTQLINIGLLWKKYDRIGGTEEDINRLNISPWREDENEQDMSVTDFTITLYVYE